MDTQGQNHGQGMRSRGANYQPLSSSPRGRSYMFPPQGNRQGLLGPGPGMSFNSNPGLFGAPPGQNYGNAQGQNFKNNHGYVPQNHGFSNNQGFKNHGQPHNHGFNSQGFNQASSSGYNQGRQQGHFQNHGFQNSGFQNHQNYPNQGGNQNSGFHNNQSVPKNQGNNQGSPSRPPHRKWLRAQLLAVFPDNEIIVDQVLQRYRNENNLDKLSEYVLQMIS